MESNLFFPIIVSAHDENLVDAPRSRVQSLYLTVPLCRQLSQLCSSCPCPTAWKGLEPSYWPTPGVLCTGMWSPWDQQLPYPKPHSLVFHLDVLHPDFLPTPVFLPPLFISWAGFTLLDPNIPAPWWAPWPGLAAVSGICVLPPTQVNFWLIDPRWGRPYSVPMVPALDLALWPYLDTGHCGSLDLPWPGCHHPACPHSQQGPLIFCALEAMSLVTCSAVSAISQETLTVTQILRGLTSLQFYLAIYLLLLILRQKNIDVLLNTWF